ncbi:hypothetical protein DSO57_1017729 [Entomophthora muscae]|uniref:Uncharacterized protein n=2 Tax=Entomophthora muscae TaxID=34485 RepID=A0ACC2TFU6_9FUNG|nr:hypothetical protein DSO57_1017728 [Entomophthora muscae]KAJ9073327.1 hypothetical protein DSO57_1017729 [Entomophthora muscae]
MKFHIATLISLVALQAGALSFDRSSLGTDSQPDAQYSAPIVKRSDKFMKKLNKIAETVGQGVHDAKKIAKKTTEKPSILSKISNKADKYGEKVFNTVVDSSANAVNGVKRNYRDATKPKPSGKYDKIREKYNLKPTA